MKTAKQKRKATPRAMRFIRLMKVLGLQFRVFFVVTVLSFIGSACILYFFYPKHELPPHHHTFLGMAYDTLQMIFFESPIPFVDDWRLAPLFFGLPILGLVVIAEGVVHMGNLLFQRNMYTREWQEMLAATYEDHIIVCGLGNVGFRVVQHLRKLDEEVVCIEGNADGSFIPEMEKYDTPVLIGDVRNVKMLENANVKRAKALIAVTDNDLANLETALTARELHPGIRVVIRMFDQKLAQQIEKSFGIHCAFSTSALSAPVFAQSALSGNILGSFEFGGTVVNAFQLVVDEKSPLLGLTVEDIRKDYESTVLMHQRNGSVDWNPASTTSLAAHDKLLIMSDNQHVHNLLTVENPICPLPRE